jgi:undecaprenyl diphosphate synthase
MTSMTQLSSEMISARSELGIPDDRFPRHIAIIMDGNGRWAVQRQLARIAGHRAGAKAVRTIVTECARLGLDALTLYSFSIENWKRPVAEVDALMELLLEYLGRERDELIDNNIRFIQLGRRDGLPASVLQQLDETRAATASCTGLTLALALNYGSRLEITDAVRSIAEDVKAGNLAPSAIEEADISERLYTAGLPDPDLLIRTAGELRVSNYLLWQISYAEIHVTDVFWPDFGTADLHEAIRNFAQRHRRFGGVDSSNS